jgi:hypothetical protein
MAAAAAAAAARPGRFAARALALLLAALALASAQAPGAPGGGPAAPPLVFLVARGEEALVRLAGFDASGRALATTFLTLPAGSGAGAAAGAAAAALSASAAASLAPSAAPAGVGAVFELSQLFVTQGLQPRRGRAAIAPPLTLAPAAGNRALFVAPSSAPPLGMWANLTYRVADGASGRASTPGLAFFVPPHGRLAHSDFRADADGWRVQGKAQLSREGFSRGLLSQYLVATDAAVQSGGAGAGAGARGGGAGARGGDANLWRFLAPAKFLGNKVGAFGGALVFTAGAFAGDFSADQLHASAPLATLECATCRGGQGVRLGFFPDNPPPDPGSSPTAAAAAAAAAAAGANAARGSGVVLDGKTKRFSLPLTAASWRKDPRNSLLSWPAVADCEFVQVLSALSQISILGVSPPSAETRTCARDAHARLHERTHACTHPMRRSAHTRSHAALRTRKRASLPLPPVSRRTGPCGTRPWRSTM